MNILKKFLVLSVGIFLFFWGEVLSGQEFRVSPMTSSGTIFIVEPGGHYVMIQKENGKKISLALTSETAVFLNGERLSLEKLNELKKGFSVTVEHYTNDAGMQQTVWLKAQGQPD